MYIVLPKYEYIMYVIYYENNNIFLSNFAPLTLSLFCRDTLREEIVSWRGESTYIVFFITRWKRKKKKKDEIAVSYIWCVLLDRFSQCRRSLVVDPSYFCT